METKGKISLYNVYAFSRGTKLAFTCSKSTIEAKQQYVKPVYTTIKTPDYWRPFTGSLR